MAKRETGLPKVMVSIPTRPPKIYVSVLLTLCVAIAHASLAQTLIRLNTGLVGIIASFLSHDTKSSHASLDYKSLTNLSNSSRTEAIDSLNQLYRRLSQSQLQLSRIGGCPHCGSTRHQNCTTGQTKKSSNKKAHTSSRARTNGPVITRMPIRSSNQAQLVVLRPRNTRKSSLSSSSSTKSPSTTTHTPYSTSPIGSPLGSPLPQYAKKDPFPPQKHTGKAKSTSQKRTDSMDAHRPSPTAWPHVATDVSMPLHLPPPRLPSPQKSPPPHERNTLKRRMDKVTPSTYTFASDSTKLGEIPQRNWIKPFDYEEAERLNQEALVNGYPLPMVEGKPKKKGLFGFLRRSPAVVS